MKILVTPCPGCGGLSCLPVENRDPWRRCQTCGREFEPVPVPAVALPAHPGPSLRDPAEVAALVQALHESGAINRLPDGRLALEGVPLGRSIEDATRAVMADASLADIAAALVDADQGASHQTHQDAQGDILPPEGASVPPAAHEASSAPAGHARHGRGRNASRNG